MGSGFRRQYNRIGKKWSVPDESIATGVPASRVLVAVRRRAERLRYLRPLSETQGPNQRGSRGEIRYLSQLRFRRTARNQLRRQDHSADHLFHAGHPPGDGFSRLSLHGGVAGSARQFPHQCARERCPDQRLADLRLLDRLLRLSRRLYGLPVVMAEGQETITYRVGTGNVDVVDARRKVLSGKASRKAVFPKT